MSKRVCLSLKLLSTLVCSIQLSSVVLADGIGDTELKAALAAKSKNNNADALAHFTKAIDAGLSNNKRVAARILRAETLTSLSDYQGALAELKRCQKELPLYTDQSDKRTLTAEVFAWKGYNEVNLKMPAIAISDLKTSVAMHKGDKLEARTRAWLGHGV